MPTKNIMVFYSDTILGLYYFNSPQYIPPELCNIINEYVENNRMDMLLFQYMLRFNFFYETNHFKKQKKYYDKRLGINK